jgi:hypothetical protein
MAGAEGFEPPLAVLETAGLPLNLRPFSGDKTATVTSLLYFLMRLVFAALAAKLLHLQPFRCGLLVLGARVVSVLALRALKRNDFPHFDCSA